MTLPFIAASSYLNAAPLCFSFISGEQKERCRFLSDAAPARCAELLREGRADAALIPVIEYQRIPGLQIVPDVCVSSRRQVRSVLLVSRTPIDSVRRVALDTSSRTSAALIQIIFHKFYGLTPVYHSAAPRLAEMLETSDAALIIGDPAMLIDRTGRYVYALADEWRKPTGLPLVFAFRAMRGGSSALAGDGAGVDFLAAKEEGVANIGRIAEAYCGQLGLPREDLIRYLTENINFELDSSNLEGLQLYYQLALECGLIDDLADPLFLSRDRQTDPGARSAV